VSENLQETMGGEKQYSYFDFMLALKTLPDSVATLAFTEWLTAFALDKDRQAIFQKYIEWSKTPSWKRKPWENPPMWQDG